MDELPFIAYRFCDPVISLTRSNAVALFTVTSLAKMDILYDSDLECEEEIDLGTVNSVVQPYMYEPTPHQREPPCSSESSSDGDIDEEQEEIPTEPSEWCVVNY